MIKKISINAYKKLKDIDFEFSSDLNAISGTNGTCKTSLLHIIGNSYQKVPSNSSLLNSNEDCMAIIRKINASVNPKIEALTREARNYTDPARGISGVLYTVEYSSSPSLSFRKHNSTDSSGNRYSLKPKYSNDSKDSLPYAPVIYLGLTRLFPFGEFLDEASIKTNREFLPSSHAEALFQNYSRLSRMNIEDAKSQKMGEIKNRISFASDCEGIDSNTISAGEDNLFIILLSLESLAYYCESLKEPNSTDALLLIDEIDATLHPSLQNKLVDLFIEYQKKWNIQIIFTTHSLSLIEHLLNKKQNVIYLRDNIDKVILMKNPDMYKIRMALKEQTHKNIYIDKKVPIFSEDEEARELLTALFDTMEIVFTDFLNIHQNLHLVDADFGSDNLRKLFKDQVVRGSTMASICCLDGDQSSDLNNNIVALPGKNDPETFLCDYCKKLFDENDDFWEDEILLNLGYGKPYYIDNIQFPVDELMGQLREKSEQGESIKGIRREGMKKIYRANSEFFRYVIKRWIHDPRNQEELRLFFSNFHSMFLKVAAFHGIDQAAWSKKAEFDLAALYE